MTLIALSSLVFSAALVWGGFVASLVYLRRRPDVDEYPPGGEDDDPHLDA